MKALLSAGLIVTVIAMGSSLIAHHSLAGTYDISKPVPMTGTVTEVQWRNPHVVFRVDVTDSNGATSNWRVEILGTAGMEQVGLKWGEIKPGAVIHGVVFLAKDGTHLAAFEGLTMPDGRDIHFPKTFTAMH